ncbi:COG1361 S-layer family protein [Methanolobus halotolerans]|uniref:NPCBM-associated, NEW3 domain of alpha-galactosidase n=1 Tax=Methanolobus halotolerans TaxID=2052935 RepID=A0A4E0PTV5_9EURY|nr:hypothetical protein [Methanolobus halotolerans]TGC08327.1 hypothetical protein CUN85_09630 [Methanolobus halotolerans]
MIKIENILRSVPVVLMVFLVLFSSQAYAQEMTTVSLELPDFFNFDENYYTVYGGPDVSATLIGDNEFSRSDEVTLSINLMNKGVITGFKSEDKAPFGSDLEHKLQRSEMGYEAQRTTAIGIVAMLNSSSPYIRVKSGPQEAGSLSSGQQLDNPVRFNIEVSKNAPAGEYPLDLLLQYGYQENVQVSGDHETDLGITNMEVGLWYAVGQQVQPISVVVKEKAEFEVVNITGELEAGKEGLLRVTYKNVGEEPISDATVRISADDPFSTTDDQSFIGSIAPGKTTDAVFRLKVDESAVSKAYAINSEIKYEDSDGHSQISDTIKIRVETLPAGASGSGLTNIAVVGAVILVILGLVYVFSRKLLNGRGGDK